MAAASADERWADGRWAKGRWAPWLAALLGAVVAVEVVAAVWLCVSVEWLWRDALEAFVVTNSVMGVAFAVCGAIIAWHRPSNPIGWLFVAAGLAHATSALAAPLAEALHDAVAPVGAVRLTVTVFTLAWPWSIGLFLPLALLLFPDGRPASRAWRPVVLAVVVTSPLFVVEMGSAEPPGGSLPSGYFRVPSFDSLEALWLVSEIRVLATLLLAVVAMVVRYRRGDEQQRRQLLWLLLATVVALAFIVPWSFVAGTPIVVLFAIPLIPAAVTVAIVRYQLLDIRLVVSRAVAWALLSLAVVVTYVVLVALLDRIISEQVGRSVVATLVVALLVGPLLPRLQRLVDRAMYGDRRDPALVASRVGRHLAAASGGLSGVAPAVRAALRMPYVAVSTPRSVVSVDGEMVDHIRAVALTYGGETVGELVVGLRPGESELADADRNVLQLVAAPLAVAVHATALTAELQASREQIVAAREEERRRLRRDLHDGLGPALTGLAFAADAASNLVDSDVARTRELLAALGADAREALADVRRLVDDLRPPALDELGLVGALRRQAERTTRRADGGAVQVQLDVPSGLPALPAAIEVAAYRIATEALTNVVRHSSGSAVVLALRCGVSLDVEVLDDGTPNGAWKTGVGLQSMRERAAELGGRFEAGPSPSGGRVYACLPLVAT